jgi:hypothetical protein
MVESEASRKLVAVVVPVVVSATVMVPATVMFTKIPVTVAVPMMVVVAPAVIALPVPIKEALAIMVRTNPTCARIRRTSPVSGMPPVVASHRIPVSFHPYEFRAWAWR